MSKRPSGMTWKRQKMYRAVGYRYACDPDKPRPKCPTCGEVHPGVRGVTELGVTVLSWYFPFGHRDADGEPCRGVPWHTIELD